jgi:ATP-dependent DNA helicase PIF1
VIPKGTPADELKACIKQSYLWPHVQKLSLTTNMRVRVHGDASQGTFAKQLLDLGNGNAPVDPLTGIVSFPPDFCCMVRSTEELQEIVFPNIELHLTDHQWLRERAILAPKNDSVNAINFRILTKLAGSHTIYKSIDTVVDLEQAVNYPTEFLNSLEPPGMPPHMLFLKEGVPVMLLRNTDAPHLCNGTRLSVRKLLPNVIEATVLTGCAKGQNIFIV